MGESAEDLVNWRSLYHAALFETDTSKLPQRIEEARKAIVARARRLFETSPNYDCETEAIDDALYALQALEDCLKSHTKDRRRAARAG
jgi:predicted ATPase with chaperone activity